MDFYAVGNSARATSHDRHAQSIDVLLIGRSKKVRLQSSQSSRRKHCSQRKASIGRSNRLNTSHIVMPPNDLGKKEDFTL